jgi:transposase
VETNATRMCALLVGVPDVTVLGVDDQPAGPIRVHVEQCIDPPRRAGCRGGRAGEGPPRELVDVLASGARPESHRWSCPEPTCPVGSWTAQDSAIAPARLAITDRADRWATAQVGRHGRTVIEAAGELGCDWHTVYDAVMAYATPLVEDPDRVGAVSAVRLDEVRFARKGPWRTQAWSTSIADVATGQLLDVIEGRSAAGACRWYVAAPRGGARRSPGRCWTCPVRGGSHSTACCPGRPSWRTRTMWSRCATRRHVFGGG